MSALDAALRDAADWLTTLAANGPDLTVNAHRKALREAQELAEDPTPEEWADVAICLVGTALAHGWTADALGEAVAAKVTRNRARTWRQEEDGTWQHVETCPTCGGESMLRGRCVLPWCVDGPELPQDGSGDMGPHGQTSEIGGAERGRRGLRTRERGSIGNGEGA